MAPHPGRVISPGASSSPHFLVELWLLQGNKSQSHRRLLESCPPGTVQGMHRSALLSSSDEQWQACKLIVWITGTARAAVTRFTGQICHERASVSSLTDAWVWTAASSGRKKPTNLSSPVVPSAGKEPMSAWGKGRKRPHYLDSQLWFSTGWTCTTWVGSWRLQKTLGALAEYGKAAIVLKSLPVPGNAG